MPKPEVVWQPRNSVDTSIDKYRHHVNTKFHLNLSDSYELHAWTIEKQQDFWLDLYDYLELSPAMPRSVTRAYDESLSMSSNPPFFEGLHMNYAENVLTKHNSQSQALIGIREGQDLEGEKVTWGELKEQVRVLSSALRRKGVKHGEVVAALVSNSIVAIALFLATVSQGAVFTSINPDLGTEGCVTRLTQVTPVLFFADCDAVYKGQRKSTVPKVKSIVDQLEQKPDVYMIPTSGPVELGEKAFGTLDDFIKLASPKDNLVYERVDFKHPLLICYSSGTTGNPKCIVHQHGAILNLKKVSMIHNSLGPGEVVMQYSSTSWVMFYIMNGHLSTGATTICYDGSPTYPDERVLLRILEKHRVTYFGTSPRYLLTLESKAVCPAKEFDLSKLRMVNTTGATLSADQYRWFYKSFPRSTHLCNVAGGTDTITSLVAANPAGPVRAGEMQMFGLGMDVDVADAETGESIKSSGSPGELVLRKPFPSMPAFFWGDHDGSIYRAAYFERFENVDVWAQHDWISFNPETKGLIMHGRSDGVLNPSGIRFGSGEIYAVCEGPAFIEEIAETLCVGRRRPQDTDEAVFLFVKMNAGHKFSDALLRRLRNAVRSALSPRHVPRFIVEVYDIPITINGKKTETAVKQLISGKEIKISSTVANPECLESYKSYRVLEDLRESKL